MHDLESNRRKDILMRKLETAMIVILAAAAPSALAQQSAEQTEPGLASATADQNMQQMSDSAFSRWDRDDDNRLRGDEFAAGLHNAWAGDDNTVDETDFNEQWNNWFNVDLPDFASLDEDGNEELSEAELRATLANAELRGPWQGADDGYLTPAEFQNGMNTVADRDGSGALNQSEIDRVVAIVGVFVPDRISTAATYSAAQEASDVQVDDVISLAEWNNDALYQKGWSAEELFDRKVFGRDGEEIGDVEDLIIGSNGELLALVAEVGGIWDIGDTHISIPWEQVKFREDGAVSVPVTEENADEFSILNEPGAQELQQGVVSDLDNRELGPRAWRASELMGDIARILSDRSAGSGEPAPAAATKQAEQDEAPSTANQPRLYQGYGYVSDLIFDEGRVAAAVVDRDSGYGTRGRYAYPYYGYDHGWTPGSRHYDLPYNRQEAVTITSFDYDRLNES
ncbi:hypothetical protein ASE36_21105 [Rhizobium sp. Root274]|nr:hypothetical protein ASC71_21165 [Rhizobium sp. Root1240]KRD26059.1 hypothetical protein ASE36_21105 [Rhizobium sp. Root274]